MVVQTLLHSSATEINWLTITDWEKGQIYWIYFNNICQTKGEKSSNIKQGNICYLFVLKVSLILPDNVWIPLTQSEICACLSTCVCFRMPEH